MRGRATPPDGWFRQRGARVWLLVLLLLALAVAALGMTFAGLRDDRREAGPPPDETAPDASAGTSLRTVFTVPRPAAPGRGRPGSGVGAPGAGDVEYVPGRLIVKFADGTTPDVARRVLARVDADLEASVAPLDVRVVDVPPGETRDAIETVTDSPAVVYVERDVVVQTFGTIPNDTLWGEQWGPVVVDAPSAWDLSKGSPSTVVAVLDTGVDPTHPDLEGSLVAGYDFVNGDGDPLDDEGHGTAAAGVVAARTNNSQGQAGICWQCSLMAVKVLDAEGEGTMSDVAAGIVWAVDHGARVISMSLGGPATTQTLADAVAYATAKGAVLVAAAGNEGSSEPSYPAALDGVIGVAGTTRADALYSWSNLGLWAQVAAPGCNVAPYPNGEYVNFCGTSSATPIVAGIAGLALSARPQATRRQVEDALAQTASGLGSAVRYGRVDAKRALEALSAQVPAPAAAPAPATRPARPSRRASRGGSTAGTQLGRGERFFLSGRTTATLTFAGSRPLTLTLVNPRGAAVARVSGRSPLRLLRTVRAGSYRFLVRGDRRVRFTLRVASGG